MLGVVRQQHCWQGREDVQGSPDLYVPATLVCPGLPGREARTAEQAQLLHCYTVPKELLSKIPLVESKAGEQEKGRTLQVTSKSCSSDLCLGCPLGGPVAHPKGPFGAPQCGGPTHPLFWIT